MVVVVVLVLVMVVVVEVVVVVVVVVMVIVVVIKIVFFRILSTSNLNSKSPPKVSHVRRSDVREHGD